MTTVEVFAPAKINLTLHVTARRADGYHEIDSLVAFAPVHDTLTLCSGDRLKLTVEGPEAAGLPSDMDNLVMKAAAAVARDRGASMSLVKNLPQASGIGGGSSDAAAAIRGLASLRDGEDWTGVSGGNASDALADAPGTFADLGADVPMCLTPRPLRARGTGTQITYVDMPPVPALLANPRVAVATADVFEALASRDNPPMPRQLPAFNDADALIDWLSGQRNDLEQPALTIAPVIGDVLDALRGLVGCRLARMSGSGATCFGLFDTLADARSGAAVLQDAQPDWWLSAGLLGDQAPLARPRIS